jgi:hypothetical protein
MTDSRDESMAATGGTLFRRDNSSDHNLEVHSRPLKDPGQRQGRILMTNEKVLRDHVLELLTGGHAHLTFETALADLPAKLRGAKPPGLSHTPWRLIEHMRIAQWDILRFSIDRDHVSPAFPEGYWPEGDAPPSLKAWDQSITAFQADLQAMIDLVASPKTDLFCPFPHGQGQTLLREALLVADHNAYHLGQLVVVRKLLGAWHDQS